MTTFGLLFSSDWDNLSNQQKGKLAELVAIEYFLRNEFEVFTPCVDDRGIDLLVRRERTSQIFEIQVKGVRKNNYVYLKKRFFTDYALTNRLVCYIRMDTYPQPDAFLIPLSEWSKEGPVFKIRDYDPKKHSSEPEYGINYSKKNAHLLEPFKFDRMINNKLVVSPKKNALTEAFEQVFGTD